MPTRFIRSIKCFLVLFSTCNLLTACQAPGAPRATAAPKPVDNRSALIAENEAFIETIKGMRDGGYVMYLQLPAIAPIKPPPKTSTAEADWWKDCLGMPALSQDALQDLVKIGYAMQRIWPSFSEIRIGETCAFLDAVSGLNIPAKPVIDAALNPSELQQFFGKNVGDIRGNAVEALQRLPAEFGNVLAMGWAPPIAIPGSADYSGPLRAGDAMLFRVKKDGLEFVRIIEQRLWMPYARRAFLGTNLPRPPVPADGTLK
ncbi:MAG: hypothetical protein ACK5OB_19125 [Pirellula sp.]